MEFKDIFKQMRIEKNIGQQKLAEYLGVSNAVISFWETGRNEPTAQMLIKIANFFEVTTDYLLGREDDFGNVTITAGDVTGNGNTVNSNNVIHSRTAAQLIPADSELIKKYHSAPAEIRKAVDKLLS